MQHEAAGPNDQGKHSVKQLQAEEHQVGEGDPLGYHFTQAVGLPGTGALVGGPWIRPWVLDEEHK